MQWNAAQRPSHDPTHGRAFLGVGALLVWSAFAANEPLRPVGSPLPVGQPQTTGGPQPMSLTPMGWPEPMGPPEPAGSLRSWSVWVRVCVCVEVDVRSVWGASGVDLGRIRIGCVWGVAFYRMMILGSALAGPKLDHPDLGLQKAIRAQIWTTFHFSGFEFVGPMFEVPTRSAGSCLDLGNRLRGQTGRRNNRTSSKYEP